MRYMYVVPSNVHVFVCNNGVEIKPVVARMMKRLASIPIRDVQRWKPPLPPRLQVLASRVSLWLTEIAVPTMARMIHFLSKSLKEQP